MLAMMHVRFHRRLVLEVLGEIALSPTCTKGQLACDQGFFLKHNITYRYAVEEGYATFWFYWEKVCTTGDYWNCF